MDMRCLALLILILVAPVGAQSDSDDPDNPRLTVRMQLYCDSGADGGPVLHIEAQSIVDAGTDVPGARMRAAVFLHGDESQSGTGLTSAQTDDGIAPLDKRAAAYAWARSGPAYEGGPARVDGYVRAIVDGPAGTTAVVRDNVVLSMPLRTYECGPLESYFRTVECTTEAVWAIDEWAVRDPVTPAPCEIDYDVLY